MYILQESHIQNLKEQGSFLGQTHLQVGADAHRHIS